MSEREACDWPNGTCACYAEQAVKPDYAGCVWMHSDYGLSLSKASISRFVMFCLLNNVEIGSIHPFNRHYPGSEVSASVRIHPDLIPTFETETKVKLMVPPRLSVSTSDPGDYSNE